MAIDGILKNQQNRQGYYYFIATGSSKLSLFTANQVDNNQIICCQISYIQTCLRESYHGSVHKKMI